MISQNSLIAHVGPSRMTASGIWWSICGCLVLRLIVRVYSKYVETQSHWAHASRPAILLFVLFRFVCRIWILRGPSSSSMSSMNIYTVYTVYIYIYIHTQIIHNFFYNHSDAVMHSHQSLPLHVDVVFNLQRCSPSISLLNKLYLYNAFLYINLHIDSYQHTWREMILI